MPRLVGNGLNLANQRITAVAPPNVGTDAANKDYVDGVANGRDWKESVRVASTANIDLATGGLLTIDGVALAAGDRVLVKNQTAGAENGIYTAASGAWARAADAVAGKLTAGSTVTATEGSTNADRRFVLTTNDPITVGTTALTWTVDAGGAAAPAAGAGLTGGTTSYDVGAGTGITVTADAVGIDTTVVVRKVSASVGNGTATSIAVTHNLGTRDVTVGVYDTATFEEVWPDVTHTDINTVTLAFATAPATGAFRAVVHG